MCRTKRLDLPIISEYGLQWKAIRVPSRVASRFASKARVYGPLALRDELPETEVIRIPIVVDGKIVAFRAVVPYGSISDRTIIRIVRVWFRIAKTRLAESRKKYGGAWHPATWRDEAAVEGLRESLRYWRGRSLRRSTANTRPEIRGQA